MKVWARIRQALDVSGSAALVSVLEVRGSAPREAGARIVLSQQGFHGTIGGGALEWRALAAAQAELSHGMALARTLDWSLGPDMGQCCGGRVVLGIETFTRDTRAEVEALAEAEAAGPFITEATLVHGRWQRRILPGHGGEAVLLVSSTCMRESYGIEPRRLFLFGAGHVGRALVLALAPLDFVVTWIDSRPDAFPAAQPGNCSLVAAADPVAELDRAAPGDMVAIMTHSHPLDLALADRALRIPGLAYLGVIGSATKRARFRSRLSAAGIPPAALDRMVCPIGVGGPKSHHPAVIAAATAVELIVADEAARALDIRQSLEDLEEPSLMGLGTPLAPPTGGSR